jgi:hypothetical protein
MEAISAYPFTNRYDIGNIKQALPHFFSKSAMRGFSSRVSSQVYESEAGVFFVTSEQFTGSNGRSAPRMFTVRQFIPATTDTSADVRTITAFNTIEHRALAHRVATLCAKHGIAVAREKYPHYVKVSM